MKLSETLNALEGLNEIRFKLPNGELVPPHFHITEVGQIDKHFIDCGGTIRKESKISFQLYTASDYDHRLGAEKLDSIIRLSIDKLGLGDHPIEVEYQSETIGKFGLEFNGNEFELSTMHTDCLAKDNCGIPTEKPKVKLSEISAGGGCCDPSSGCC